MSDAVKIKLTKKDLESDQDVRWCPGCGDYAILATVQRTLAQIGIKRENTVFISGIGCSSRFPYYMNTYGSLRQAQQGLAAQGKKVSHAHLRWLSPLEPGLAKVIKNFKHVLVAELNMGQLRVVLRDKFLVDAHGLNKIQGQPFKVREVTAAVENLLNSVPAQATAATQPRVEA